MAVITSRDTWNLVTQESNMKKGPLIKVEIRPGQFVKMYASDAEKAGHIKSRPKPDDKMRRPEQDKGEPPVGKESEEKPQVDDFATIPGIGPATARAIVANGIITFEQLRSAGEIAYLTEKANQAIREWREQNATS